MMARARNTALLAAVLTLAVAPAALADSSGGTTPDSSGGGSGSGSGSGASGGSGYGSKLKTLPGRPRLVSQKLADSSITAGSRAAVRLKIRRSHAGSARVQLRITGTRKKTVNAGAVKTNSTQSITLPALPTGRYAIRVTVLGSTGQSAARGKTLRLTVKAKPKASPTPTVPTNGSGVFPVQGGSWSFGGDGARFGAGRPGHTHEGQDVVGDSGLNIVAPLAGFIRFVDYQEGGAGRYVVMRADNGWDMFFAHMQMKSVVVKEGDRVQAGQKIGLLGSTGYSTGPHLHFEIWPDGWKDKAGTSPIDPLPQLKRWAN